MENNDPNREEYATLSNNCITFCEETLDAGGVKTPWMADPRPNSYIKELQGVDTFSVTYNPKTKKIKHSRVGTEQDPIIQAIRQQYASRLGNRVIEEEEKIYEYRVQRAWAQQ